jgi:hypothetical protein
MSVDVVVRLWFGQRIQELVRWLTCERLDPVPVATTVCLDMELWIKLATAEVYLSVGTHHRSDVMVMSAFGGSPGWKCLQKGPSPH